MTAPANVTTPADVPDDDDVDDNVQAALAELTRDELDAVNTEVARITLLAGPVFDSPNAQRALWLLVVADLLSRTGSRSHGVVH